jgi:hypothetical protein
MLKRFIVANKYYIEANSSNKTALIYVKDEASAKLPGIEKYALGEQILREDITKYKHIDIHKKEKSRFSGVDKAEMIDIILPSGHVYRFTKAGIMRGIPN